MKTIKGPAILLAQFVEDKAPYDYVNQSDPPNNIAK
jgi:hypothetical protein